MSSIMQQIPGVVSPAAQPPAAISGVKEPQNIQRHEDAAPAHSPRAAMDEYIRSEKRVPSGLYWVDRDEDGQPKVYFDDPEQAADEPQRPDGFQREAAGEKAESCTCCTDQVDREIERLKKQRAELEQQISAQTDDARTKELEKKLAQIESELSQKDNDAYRRRHAVFF